MLDSVQVQTILDSSVNGVLVYEAEHDRAGRLVALQCTYANASAARVTHRSVQELLELRLSEDSPAAYASLYRRYRQVLLEGTPTEFELDFEDPDGDGHSDGIYRISVCPLQGAIAATFVDLTEVRGLERALRRQQQRLQHIVDNATDMVSMHTMEGDYLYVTPACERLTGHRPADLVGTNAYVHFHPNDLEAIAASHEGCVRQGEDRQIAQYRLRRADGSYVWVVTSSKQIAGQQKIICVTRDVSERKRLEKELLDLAERDPITGLLNRRGATKRIEEHLALHHRYGRPLSLFLLDLDHFKQVNDVHGHAAGDAVLTSVAACLGDSTGDCDFAARLGGEEFLMVLPDTGSTARGARRLAVRLGAQLRQSPVRIPQGALTITASIGVATANPDARTFDELLRQADEAMYRAKATGRDRVVVTPQPQVCARRVSAG